MKKFSNKTEDIKVKIIPTKMDETLSKIVNDTIKTKIESEELTTKKIIIEGKSELVNKIIELVKLEEENAAKQIKESIRLNFNNFVNVEKINEDIQELENEYDEYETVLSPYDVFHSEDYNDGILKSLNNVPSSYMDYLNMDDVQKYFNDGNTISIIDTGGVWNISFVGDAKQYGTSISSEEEKINLFEEEYADFLNSFTEATNEIVEFDAEIIIV